MQIEYVSIKNLRCIENTQFFPKNYTTLIGPNNGGKSSVLRAVELFLTNSSPELDEWRHGSEAEPIEIRIRFSELTDWERGQPGIASLVYNNKIDLKFTLNRVNNGDEEKVEKVWAGYISPEDIEGWGERWGELSAGIKTIAATIGFTNGNDFRSSSSKEQLKSAIREQAPDLITRGDPIWTTEGISIANAFQQALPLVQVIPAIRDPITDSKPGASSSFGVLLKRIVVPALTRTDEYQGLVEAVDLLRRRLGGEGENALVEVDAVIEAINTRLSTLIDAKIQIDMDTPDAEKFLGGSTYLRLGDNQPTRVGLQGHGLQRAMIFAMLELLAAQTVQTDDNVGCDTGRSVILLFEEPELFIHPQLMRKLAAILKTISEDQSWQVISTTHAPVLVDVASDPTSLVIFSRPFPDRPPATTQIEHDPFEGDDEDRERLRALLTFHPTACEAFFAKRVVLVEGDSEVAILRSVPELADRLEISVADMLDVCIVSCAGKWTIPPMVRILKAFGIPIRVIHDLDLKGRDPETINPGADPYNANSRISTELQNNEMLHVSVDRLEVVLWEGQDPPQSNKQKAYRAYQRAHQICTDDELWTRSLAFQALTKFALHWEG